MKKDKDIENYADDLGEELTEDEMPREEQPVRKKSGGHKYNFIERLFGVFLATGIILVIFGLGVEYVIVKGPSDTMKNVFVMTMLETRRFGFIPNIFLSEDEVAAIKQSNSSTIDVEMDSSLINIPTANPGNPETNNPESAAAPMDYGLVDEDGDGIILDKVKGAGFNGYMLIVLDPKRVSAAITTNLGESGARLDQMCAYNGAIGGINAGGFIDDGGNGSGGTPAGLTIVDGVCYEAGSGADSFAGFDANGILHVGYYSMESAQADGIINGVTFEPLLIVNGEAADLTYLVSGVNPRTAIGQRADGAVLMLVIDGRQVASLGATYQDVIDVMLDYGCVNACNMDGGSSTCMYFNGEYVNNCSSATGVRTLPTAFIVK